MPVTSLLYPSPPTHEVKWSESCSVVSNSLGPHGLYSPWNSPGQNARVRSLSLLQGIFLTQGSNLGLWHCRQILDHMSHQGSPKFWSQRSYHCATRSQKTEMPKQGHEPWPLRLKVWCSTNWAIQAYIHPKVNLFKERLCRTFLIRFWRIKKQKTKAIIPDCEEEKLKFYVTSCSFCLCNSACSLQSLDHAGHVVSESGDLQY